MIDVFFQMFWGYWTSSPWFKKTPLEVIEVFSFFLKFPLNVCEKIKSDAWTVPLFLSFFSSHLLSIIHGAFVLFVCKCAVNVAQTVDLSGTSQTIFVDCGKKHIFLSCWAYCTTSSELKLFSQYLQFPWYDVKALFLWSLKALGILIQ